MKNKFDALENLGDELQAVYRAKARKTQSLLGWTNNSGFSKRSINAS